MSPPSLYANLNNKLLDTGDFWRWNNNNKHTLLWRTLYAEGVCDIYVYHIGIGIIMVIHENGIDILAFL